MPYQIRAALPDDLPRLMEIEALTFPAAEAATEDVFAYRIHNFNEWFHVAISDRKIVGLINGRQTSLDYINDELYEPEGSSIGDYFALLCVETDPAWQKKGIAEAMINHTIALARSLNLNGITLACKDRLIPYYQKFGFQKTGVSKSVHGGAIWNDMRLTL